MASASAHNEQSNRAFKLGDYDSAYRHYSRAIKADSSVAKYWSNRANPCSALFRLGRTRQVIEDADAAVAADPSWVKGYYFKGIALEKLGFLQQAISVLQQAVQVDRSCSDAVAALERCQASEQAAHRTETAASSDSFCNNPERAQQLFNSSLKNMTHAIPHLTRQQQQQTMQFGKAHKFVVMADTQRFNRSPPNLEKAAQLYKKAAELGSASGQFNYAQMIKHRDIQEPVAAAMPWLLKVAAQDPMLPIGCPNVGVVQSWVTLGDMYRDGLTRDAPDYAAALQWYQKAAEHGNAGDAMAQNNIAQLYMSGRGVQRDLGTAAAWLRKAADQGYGVAELNLAHLLYEGAPGVPRDDAAALDLAQRAEQHGVAEAATLVAVLEPSCEVAAEKMRKAAEAGDPAASFMMAQAYFDGLHGCEKDMVAASKWLHAAAVDGKLRAAQLQLGLAYRAGIWGCEVKPTKAISFIEKAAYQGLDEAMVKAAHCHM